jgi:hypothetical protein
VRHRGDEAGVAFLFQSVAVAWDQQGVTVMQQTIEDGRGEDFFAEDGAPLRYQLIGGDEETAALVATCDQLKEQVRAAALERTVSTSMANVVTG